MCGFEILFESEHREITEVLYWLKVVLTLDFAPN